MTDQQRQAFARLKWRALDRNHEEEINVDPFISIMRIMMDGHAFEADHERMCIYLSLFCQRSGWYGGPNNDIEDWKYENFEQVWEDWMTPRPEEVDGKPKKYTKLAYHNNADLYMFMAEMDEAEFDSRVAQFLKILEEYEPEEAFKREDERQAKSEGYGVELEEDPNFLSVWHFIQVFEFCRRLNMNFKEACKKYNRNDIIDKYANMKEYYLKNSWREIYSRPVDVPAIMKMENLENRRFLLEQLSPQEVVTGLGAKLVNTETKLFKNLVTDLLTGEQSVVEVKDKYDLYQVDASTLFGTAVPSGAPSKVNYVRCNCTTTGREYHIRTPYRARTENSAGKTENVTYENALDAIARTFPMYVPLDTIDYLFRQGDVLYTFHKKGLKEVPKLEEPYYLTGEQYFNLLKGQS